jgi:rod shape-determining protein MreD
MKNVIEACLGILAALVVFTLLRRIPAAAHAAINVFTLAVILFSLIKGEIAGAWMGMACGLIVDTFSFGVFGIAGVANTLTGFFTGLISRKINVLPFVRNFVFIGLMAALELAVWILFTFFIFAGGVAWEHGLIFLQPLVAALVGSVLFAIYRKISAAHER